jgi:hypothetical protein
MPINDDQPIDPFGPAPGNDDQQVPEPEQATPADAAAPTLSALHRRLLEQVSGIAFDAIRQRGYFTATTKKELAEFKFSSKCSLPAIVWPIIDLDGNRILYQARPDRPRMNKSGELAKYELPKGSRRKIDVPPGSRERVQDATIPLFITVGVFQADAAVSKGLCCIALLGNGGWRNQEAFWNRVPLANRTVYLVFNSDLSSRIAVQRQAAELKEFLERRGATAKVIRLPPRDDKVKVGLDDFLAAGHSVEDLLALSTNDVPSTDSIEPDNAPKYVRTKHGLCLQCYTDNGDPYLKPLCNFDVRIAVELTVTDGISWHKELEIEARLDGEIVTICIHAEEFNRLDWIVQYLGARAVVYAGNGMKERLRAAIQLLSLDTIAARTVYLYTGWVTDHLGRRQFMHAGGAIGAATSAQVRRIGPQADNPTPLPDKQLRDVGPIGPIGPQKQHRVVLPPIARLVGPLAMFRLPNPPLRSVLQDAVRASLKLLQLAPDHLSMPLLAATYRAPLGNPFYPLALDGITGRGKTTFVALFQQHFGFEMNHESLPGSFRCTPIYLEGLAFRAKDTLFTVDDLAPTGSKADVERLNRDAEHFLRSVGNRSGRGRCDRDGTPRMPVMPRAQVVITQEQPPEGHSLNARNFRLEANKYDILAPHKLEQLRDGQKAGDDGAYARAMAGYLQWLATDFDRIQEGFRTRMKDFRDAAHTFCGHPRIAAIISDLLAGFEVFLDFCEENEVIDDKQYRSLWQRMHDVLIRLAAEQDSHLKSHDPVDQFFELMHAALLSRSCHIEDLRGGPPEEAPGAWGWRADKYLVQKNDDDSNSSKTGAVVFANATTSQNATKASDDGGKPQASANAPDNANATKVERKTWMEERERWRDCGPRIGFVDGDRLFLIPKAAVAAVQKQARDMGLYFALTERSLGRYLDDAGKLVAKERDYRVRRNAAGSRPWFLFVNATEIMQHAFVGQPWQDPEYAGPSLESLIGERLRQGLPADDLMEC